MKINLKATKKIFNKAATKQILMLLTTTTAVGVCSANPVLSSIVNGAVTVTQSGNTETVNQSSQQAIINWNSFNISSHQTTNFVQPNSSAVALNHINPSQGASQIFGTLKSNGTIILVNGAGINFASGANVNVGGLIASTSDISNSNFLAGNYTFDIPTTYSNAAIVNSGKIIAAANGLVALIGQNVTNNGSITASLGSVVLATGSTFTLNFSGDDLINFSVNSAAANGGRIANNDSRISTSCSWCFR